MRLESDFPVKPEEDDVADPDYITAEKVER